jgi:hypothetical protein
VGQGEAAREKAGGHGPEASRLRVAVRAPLRAGEPSTRMLATAAKGPVKGRAGSGLEAAQGDSAPTRLYQCFTGLVDTQLANEPPPNGSAHGRES